MCEGLNGEPVCRIDPAALEPWWTGRPPKKWRQVPALAVTESGRKHMKRSKEQKPGKYRRDKEKAERWEREFAAPEVLETLEEMQAQREWAEALQGAEQARRVAEAAMEQLRGAEMGTKSESDCRLEKVADESRKKQRAAGSAAVAATVRAVEVIERHARAGEWLKVDASKLLGTEQEVEGVDPDEYCVPELPKPTDVEEFMTVVDRLAEESKFQEPGSKERYKEIMRKHYGAYCLRLEQFVPGRLDVPKLSLAARPGAAHAGCAETDEARRRGVHAADDALV